MEQIMSCNEKKSKVFYRTKLLNNAQLIIKISKRCEYKP